MLFEIELIAEQGRPQVKRSGNKVIIKVPSTISGRLNSIRPKGHTSGKGTRNQGHTDVKVPKSIRNSVR